MPVYNRLIKKADKWTRDQLYEAFLSLAYETPHEQLKEWFEGEFGSGKNEEEE